MLFRSLETAGELVAGVIYNPATEELFTAEKGRGAFVNDRRMRVASRRDLSDCAIASGIPALSKKGHGDYLLRQRDLMMRVSAIRATGSAALNLAWTAAGRFDGYFETGLEAWDVAAGMLMIREAGGFVSEPDPKASIYESGRLIAGNEHVHSQLRELINKPLPQKES